METSLVYPFLRRSCNTSIQIQFKRIGLVLETVGSLFLVLFTVQRRYFLQLLLTWQSRTSRLPLSRWTKVFFTGTYDMDTFYRYSSSAIKGTFSPGSLDPQDSRLPSGRSHRDSSLAGQCTAQEQLQWRDGKVSQPELLSAEIKKYINNPVTQHPRLVIKL